MAPKKTARGKKRCPKTCSCNNQNVRVNVQTPPGPPPPPPFVKEYHTFPSTFGPTSGEAMRPVQSYGVKEPIPQFVGEQIKTSDTPTLGGSISSASTRAPSLADTEQLNLLTKAELKDMARARGHEGFSRLNKMQLIRMMRDAPE